MKFSRYQESIECFALLSFHMHIVSWSDAHMEDKVKDPHDNHGECEGDHKVEVGVSRDKSSASWCRTEWADHKPFVRRSTPSDKQMRIVWKKKTEDRIIPLRKNSANTVGMHLYGLSLRTDDCHMKAFFCKQGHIHAILLSPRQFQIRVLPILASFLSSLR